MKYVHTNLVAKDWKRLARFYEQVLGCTPAPPERDLKGKWLDDLTGLEDTHVVGMHLRLPGWGENGPTLEIFQYNQGPEITQQAPNTPGFGHIAFQVEDAPAMAEAICAHGGRPVGECVTHTYPDGRSLTVQYLADPEGNILELQRWS
jgi:predicted enzyme related to lactoylglutathione lyase